MSPHPSEHSQPAQTCKNQIPSQVLQHYLHDDVSEMKAINHLLTILLRTSSSSIAASSSLVSGAMSEEEIRTVAALVTKVLNTFIHHHEKWQKCERSAYFNSTIHTEADAS